MDNSPINYGFIGITIVSKSMEEVPPEGITNLFHFEIRVEIRAESAKNLVIPFVFVNIKNSDKTKSLAKFIIACLIEVKDFGKKILLNKENLYVIPDDFSITLRQMSLSTARGVIYSELRGTYLNNAIMPVVPINELKEDYSIEQKEVNAIVIDPPQF